MRLVSLDFASVQNHLSSKLLLSRRGDHLEQALRGLVDTSRSLLHSESLGSTVAALCFNETRIQNERVEPLILAGNPEGVPG